MEEEKTEQKFIVKKEFHRTNLKRLLHTLCLLFPVAMAFAGWYVSAPLWTLLTKKTAAPELFKFGCTAVLFLLASLIIFIATRNANPVMKISLKDVPEQAD